MRDRLDRNVTLSPRAGPPPRQKERVGEETGGQGTGHTDESANRNEMKMTANQDRNKEAERDQSSINTEPISGGRHNSD